jgi:hypothetical protein
MWALLVVMPYIGIWFFLSKKYAPWRQMSTSGWIVGRIWGGVGMAFVAFRVISFDTTAPQERAAFEIERAVKGIAEAEKTAEIVDKKEDKPRAPKDDRDDDGVKDVDDCVPDDAKYAVSRANDPGCKSVAFDRAYANARPYESEPGPADPETSLWFFEKRKKLCGSETIGVLGDNEFEWRRNEQKRESLKSKVRDVVFRIPLYEPVLKPYNFKKGTHTLFIRAGDSDLEGTFSGRAKYFKEDGFYDWQLTPLDDERGGAKDAHKMALLTYPWVPDTRGRS